MTRAEERMLADRASKAGGGYAANPYIPKSRQVNALQTANTKTGQSFTTQPKMYGGAHITSHHSYSYSYSEYFEYFFTRSELGPRP